MSFDPPAGMTREDVVATLVPVVRRVGADELEELVDRDEEFADRDGEGIFSSDGREAMREAIERVRE